MYEWRLTYGICAFLCAARLVALRKPLGGIRPIAVGEVFRRLVGKVLLRRNHTDIVKALAPMQVGVLVPATHGIYRVLPH